MRSACPTAMTTSRLTLRSLPTRSSSLDLASGRITYRSKSKLTVDAVVTFSGLGAAFAAGAAGGAAGRDGAGAGAGVGGGASGVDAQPANASRTIADSAVLSLLFMLSSRRWWLGPRARSAFAALSETLETPQNASLKLLFLLLTYSATEERACSSCDCRIRSGGLLRREALPRPTRGKRARAPPSTRGARAGRSRGEARAHRRRPRKDPRISPQPGSRSKPPGRARARRAASPRREPDARVSPGRRCPPPWREARRCAFPGTSRGGCCSPRHRCRCRH